MLPPRSQSGPVSYGNEGVVRISQGSSITGALPSDLLMAYLRYSLVGILPLCSNAVGVFYSPNQLGKTL